MTYMDILKSKYTYHVVWLVVILPLNVITPPPVNVNNTNNYREEA